MSANNRQGAICSGCGKFAVYGEPHTCDRDPDVEGTELTIRSLWDRLEEIEDKLQKIEMDLIESSLIPLDEEKPS